MKEDLRQLAAVVSEEKVAEGFAKYVYQEKKGGTGSWRRCMMKG